MRARTRLVLDAALLVALIVAYRPVWTGVSLHQWLSIAIIAPLLVHGVVNWEWTKRVIRTFFQRLLSVSRLNLVVDGALFLSAVCVMLSGLMVSPALISPLGMHPAQPLLWHVMHAYTANTTITLLAMHATLHWRWFYRTATNLAGGPAQRLRASTVSASRLVARSSRRTPAAGSVRGASRVGVRAAQAKAERAAAVRTAAVIGVTTIVGLTVFAGVGLASAMLPAPRQVSPEGVKAGLMTCPSTGCTASKCHAKYGQSAKVFYASTQAKSAVRRKPATRANVTRAASGATKRAPVRQTAKAPVPHATPKRPAHPAARPKSAKTRAAAARPVRRVMVCPHTGCTASSCHGAHHQSAAAYY